MADVPSNLIPTRITQLPTAPVADANSLMLIVYEGNNYQIRVGDLLQVAGVPVTRQVIAGTGMQGGGQLTSNVTLSIAPGGVGPNQMANSGVTPGTYGTATNIPVFTVDEKGRVVAATSVPVVVSGYVPVTRQVIAGPGLAGGGPLNADVTLNANLSNATPESGFQAGAAGVSNNLSRADHKHPAVNLGVDDEVDGVLGLSNGGTARSIVPDAGAIIWCGADGLYVGPVGVAGQILQSVGAGEYIWVNQSTLDVGQADNLNGGDANKIPYQTAADTTDFIDAPTTPDTLLKWNGTGFEWGTVAGAGTVTSVGLALPAEFTISDSPVTTSGTLTGAWASQTANWFLAAPNGTGGTPTFRAIVANDIPTLNQNTTGSAASATTATNVAGGAANQIVYNTGAGATSFISAPTLPGTYLEWSGSAYQWSANPLGTVTSVDVSGGTTGLTTSGGPVTTSGTITIGGTLAVASGGTGATDATTARGNLSAAASGANADITSMSAVTGAIATPSYIDFKNNHVTLPTDATGRLYYDNDDQFQTFVFQMNGSVAQHVGEEQFFRIKCDGSITKGQVVSFAGTLGASGGLIGKAATGLAVDQANYILGVAAESGINNDWIFVTSFGEIKDIDTTGGAENWIQGQVLYYDPTVTGGLTKNKPAAPNAIAVVAAVVNVGSTNGILFVRPTFGSVLGGTDGNVQFGTLNNGDVIVYDSTDQRWENVAQSNLTAGAATNVAGGAANQIVYNTGAGATSFVTAPTVANTYLEWSGSAFQWSANPLGTVTSVDVSGGTTGLTFTGGPITSSGTITAGGTLAIANGGTNGTATPTAGGAAYGNGTAYAFTSAGTAGQVLTSAGSSAPTWSGISGGTF